MFACRLVEGGAVSPHVIYMIGYIESLENLGFALPPGCSCHTLVAPPSFEGFIMKFHMNGMDNSLNEMHGMLKTSEESIKKSSNHVMMV